VYTTTLLTLLIRSVQKCDLFLFKILNTNLQTHFLRRYRTKQNTTLESKAAFVHLNCIVPSAPLRGRNSRERKLCLPRSYCCIIISYIKNVNFIWYIFLFVLHCLSKNKNKTRAQKGKMIGRSGRKNKNAKKKHAKIGKHA
jgi:hypothetical protein